MPGVLDIFLIGILVMQDEHERQIIWSRFRQLQLVSINHSNRCLLRGQPVHFLFQPMNFDKYEYLAYNPQDFNTMNYIYVIRR